VKEIEVVSLINQVNAELRNLGLTPKTLSNYKYDAFVPVHYHFCKLGLRFYDKQAANELVAEKHECYENGDIGRSEWRSLRRVVALMTEFYETGIIKFDTKLSPWDCLKLNPFYEKTIDEHLKFRIQQGVEKSTAKTSRSLILHFVAYFEDAGHLNFKSITPTDVLDSLKNLAEKRKSSFDLSALRAFCSYLYSQNLTDTDLSPMLQITLPKRRSVREGFSQDEKDALLATPDRTTEVGKRDYAMMMLAAQTGLRAIDVTNLKYGDIDWVNNEIKICQHKTRKALSLPLEPETGNAIADYLLNGRPKSELPYIFLTTTRPVRKLFNRSACAIVSRNLDKANIDRKDKFRGFHTFRRTIGVNMLQADVPVTTISEVLGHSNLDSAKHYLRIDEAGLKRCALSLKGIEVATEGLEI
jgi:integrase